MKRSICLLKQISYVEIMAVEEIYLFVETDQLHRNYPQREHCWVIKKSTSRQYQAEYEVRPRERRTEDRFVNRIDRIDSQRGLSIEARKKTVRAEHADL